jgi:sugar fermentation stimulation protein A
LGIVGLLQAGRLWQATAGYRGGVVRFQTPLVPARLLRRWNRFLCEARLEPGGDVVRAHCPNPGAMLGLNEPGRRIWLEPKDDPRRKLRWGWRLVELDDGHLAGIDTAVPNRVVGEALGATGLGLIEPGSLRAEVPYGKRSRVDFTGRDASGREVFIEVKNVHLRRNGDWAEFPDCVTARGTRHLEELAAVAASGRRAAMLYLVQRTDCARFRLAADLDPAYARGFDAARAGGVEMLCFGTEISREGVWLDAPLPVDPAPQFAAG